MPTLAVLTMAVAGNMIILFTSSAAVGVHALQVAPWTGMSRYSLPSSLPLEGSRLWPTTIPLTSSKLFRNKRRQVDHQIYYTSSSALRSSTPNGSNAVDAEITESSSNSSASFLRAVDNFGMKLKPWALNRYAKSVEYSNISSNNINGTDTSSSASKSKWDSNRVKSILCAVQASILWILYIVYRGYRGFFVILPAVFKEVYKKLEDSDLVVDVYGDDEEEEGKEYAVNANAEKQQQPQTMKLRTRITISVLSGMLTMSYVVSGGLRVLGKLVVYLLLCTYMLFHSFNSLYTIHFQNIIVPGQTKGKFIKTFTNTTSIESSLEAAAEEVSVNEDKLRSKLK
ncbi:hypothetical protein ACHAXR_004776 [Thalassiosira sp. AJA248-18]